MRCVTGVLPCLQFDTLPVALSGPEEMRPGDLVFVSAVYYSPKSESH